MKPEDLQVIRERCDKAVPGPWTVDKNAVMQNQEDNDGYKTMICKFVPSIAMSNNAEFIAHARTDVPALLDEIEHQRNEANVWKSATATASNTIDSLRTEIERLRGALERIERRAAQAERQFENRRDNPWRWDLSWWRGHADGLYKAAEIAREAMDGKSSN